MSLYKRGKIYWGRWRDGERIVRRSLGTCDRREAQRRLAEHEGQTEHVLTIEGLAERWLGYKRVHHRSKPRSVEAFRLAARLFTREFGDQPADDLPRTVISILAERRLRNVTPETLQNDLNHLRGMLRWGLEQGLIRSMPKVAAVRMRKRKIPKELSDSQLHELLTACRRPEFWRLEAVVRIALNSGLRREELVWLRWSDLDLTNGWLHVTAKDNWSPKNHAERAIPLREDFVAWLKRYRDARPKAGEEDWVLQTNPNRGDRWNSGFLGQEARRLFEAAKVRIPGSKHTLHLLRGTFATRYLRGGGDLESLRDILAHSDLKTTAVYLSATAESKRRGVASLELPDV